MLDPRHAQLDERMATLWQELRDWRLRLKTATTKGEQTVIRREITRLESQIIPRQDLPWLEDTDPRGRDPRGSGA